MSCTKRPCLLHNHNEMRDTARQNYNSDCRERARLVQQYMIGREHYLLRFNPQLIRDLLHRVDRCTIHICLAGLAQPS